MKKSVLAIALLAATTAQAQVLYVNNSNDTYQAINTENAKEMTFDKESRVITIDMLDGAKYMFYTGEVEELSLKKKKSVELKYSISPTVTFNGSDKENYTEIVETIPTNETHEDYGDFVEYYSPSRKVSVNYTADGPTVTTTPANIEGITYEIKGNDVTITSTKKKVAYAVQGKCDDGSLKIYSENKFQIILNGIELKNNDGPAINIQTGKTVYFTIYDGTRNSLCDGAAYSAPVITNGEEEDQKGTLFSEGQLIFNGNGTLDITSLGGHAVCSDDYIRVRSGNINILQAAKDGFHTNDKFILSRTKDASPAITINSTADGIDCGKGKVIIEAGKLEITSEGEAVKAVYEEENPDPLVTPDAVVKGGYIAFTTTGEKSSGIKTTGNFTLAGGVIEGTVSGNGSKVINCDGNIAFEGGKITGFAKGTTSGDQTSAGGIKCEGEIIFAGSTVALECTQSNSRGINSSGDITVNAGEATILTAGERNAKAVESGFITINGGKVVLCSRETTIFAAEVTVNDGILNAYSQEGTALETDIIQNGGWIVVKEK